MGDMKEVAYDVVPCPQCGKSAKRYRDGIVVAGLPSSKVVCDANPSHNWRWAGDDPMEPSQGSSGQR